MKITLSFFYHSKNLSFQSIENFHRDLDGNTGSKNLRKNCWKFCCHLQSKSYKSEWWSRLIISFSILYCINGKWFFFGLVSFLLFSGHIVMHGDRHCKRKNDGHQSLSSIYLMSPDSQSSSSAPLLCFWSGSCRMNDKILALFLFV